MGKSDDFNDDDFVEDEFEEELKEERDFSARGVSDWLKKTITSGPAAEPFLSLLGQADKTRKDVMGVMARELKAFLDNIQVQDILRKVLSNATLEVEAKIRLVPDKKKDEKAAAEKPVKKRRAPVKKKAKKG